MQGQGNERELVADFTIARDLSLLAAVKVTADKPVRASNGVSPTSLEPGSSEKWSDGVKTRRRIAVFSGAMDSRHSTHRNSK